MQRNDTYASLWPPISLASIAAVLEEEGHKVILKDYNANPATPDRIRDELRQARPALIVINTSLPTIDGDLEIAKIAKEVDPNNVTSIIGVLGTAQPRETLDLQKALDVIVRGEPEETVRQLAKRVSDQKSLNRLEGIAFRDKERLVVNRPRVPLQDLDALPFPARHHLDQTKYRLPLSGRPFTTIITSRGCPSNCSFCVGNLYYGKRFRKRSPDNIVKELKKVKLESGINDFLFWSDTFTLDKQWAISVCQKIIDSDLNIRWVANSRVNTLDRELLKKMREAGCWMLSLGIESADQQILDNCNKGVTIDQAANAIKLCKEAGMKTTAHFMFGLPGETEKTIRKIIEFAKRTDPDYAQFYCAIPYPGTSFRETALKRGWVVERPWKYYEQNISILKMNDLTPEKIMKLRNNAYKEFYLQPHKILQQIAPLRSWEDIKNVLRSVGSFIGWTR